MVSKYNPITIPRIKITPKIGIDDKNRGAVCQILSSLLADEYVLSTKTRKYHWNVNGPRFHPLHEFLKTQYEQLDGIVDEVAERIPQLGGKTIATLEEFKNLIRREARDEPVSWPCNSISFSPINRS